MAFDQTTRNRLARFVSDTRTLLTEEFTRQLQNEYGLDPASGEVTPIERLTALDDSQRETARILRETLDYYLAGNPKTDAKAFQDVLDRIVREQAFTVLNRLCALRMSEARGLVLESIAKGYQSKGFQLYARLAGSALGETGEAYQNYLFSLMDEFAIDLPVLFDRFSPQGRLFPREAALLKLLGLINDPEIDPLWTEDETIGWIYQYFNTKEERKAMRDASAAPRNSRELAVRNQFFTPRYVVEFLTDNTLGRIWYEMTRGETILKDTCRYLVRRPNEIFQDEGEEIPKQTQVEDILSQEELLSQPVYIPHRPLKDPRELKMLDPACGSMHFGLYAFDLFEQIYAEAWELEERLGEDALQRLADLDPLHKTYPDQESYLKDVPRLIIERNIHGVDIDPRAVQIAGLSLWLRAQKSWQSQGIKSGERPQIRKSNVVCAEPMPGDRQMLEEFLGTLRGDGLEALMRKAWHVPTDQRVKATHQMADALAKLVRTVWQEMELAGEAGGLLKIEETLRHAIATARKESEEKSPLFRVLEYGISENPKEQYVQFVAGEDQDFFDRAEGLVLAALKDYSEQAVNGSGFRRRLFAGDAAQGFTFIDLYRKRYDVVLMNPPYGDASNAIKEYLQANYRGQPNDLYGCFMERTIKISDFIGALTSRTFLFFSSFETLRVKYIFPTKTINAVLDLGFGVLDGAFVETCATTLRSRSVENDISVFIRLNDTNLKDEVLHTELLDIRSNKLGRHSYFVDQSLFEAIEGAPMPYWAGQNILSRLLTLPSIYPEYADVRLGAVTSDNEQYLRLRWEINPSNIDPALGWASYAKGGDYCKYAGDIHLLIDWRGDGEHIRLTFGQAVRLREIDQYLNPGLTYPLVTVKGMNVRVLPVNCVFDNGSPSIFCQTQEDLLTMLGFLNSRISELYIRCFTSSRHWQVGYVRKVPFPAGRIWAKKTEISSIVNKLIWIARFYLWHNEPSSEFILPQSILNIRSGDTLADQLKASKDQMEDLRKKFHKLEQELDRVVGDCFELKESEWDIIDKEVPVIQNNRDQFADFELSDKKGAEEIISWLIGTILGIWNIRYATDEKPIPELPDPFAPLPACPPGMLLNAQGLPAAPQDVPPDYPLRLTWSSILADDEGNPEDVEKRVRESLHVLWQERGEAIEAEVCQILGVHTLREYFRKPALFFADHLKRYSKSRRAAPIYWPLSTSSSSYTLWLYYHRLNDQTLYSCVNDFIDPKLKQVSEEAARLRLKKGRNAADEKELERLTDFERELKDFREELLRVAKFWKPNLNDGVEITAAPLWKLFQHKPWQKRLKETWQKLEAGEYDWAHLAYSIWPDRVREKCKRDKSLAIAHDLESLYVEPPVSAKKKKAKKQISDEKSEGWFNDD